MKTFYQTTRAGFHDTLHIAKQKWLQQLRYPSSAAAGTLAEPDNTVPKFHDTKIQTVQKILTALQ